MTDFTSGYDYSKGDFEVTDAVQKEYDENGYIIVRQLFSEKEIERINAFIQDKNFRRELLHYDSPTESGEGESINMIVWNYPGDDLTGWVTRCRRMVDTAEKLVGGEIYLYHAKLNLKQAKTGGFFQWHQDYGYWYENGLMRPDCITVFMALNRCDKENGCLQVLKGSHRMGRVTHVVMGKQVGVEPERLAWSKEEFPLVYVQLNPGDAVFFHCNLLHCSSRNPSDRDRNAFINSYNRMDNNPRIKHHHPFANKMEKVDDCLILEGVSPEVNWEQKDFMKPDFGRNEVTKLTKAK